MKEYYKDAAVTIYHCDARDLLDVRADLLVADPPCGINVAGKPNVGGKENVKRGGFGSYPPTRFDVSDWDKKPWPQELIGSLITTSKYAVIWGGNYYATGLR